RPSSPGTRSVSVLAAALLLPRKGRCPAKGRQATAVKREEPSTLDEVSLEREESTLLRFGVTDAFMLSWIRDKLGALLPEVDLSGVMLSRE
ncbi:unnamed protein product, partial [Effrenium voratum]